MAVRRPPRSGRLLATAQAQTCRWLHPRAICMLLGLSVLCSVSGNLDTSISAARFGAEAPSALVTNAPGGPVSVPAAAADGWPLPARTPFDWGRQKVERRRLRHQRQQASVVLVRQHLGVGRISSTKRHLLQPPPQLQQIPPNPKQQPPQITIQELMSNVGVSADNGNVQVKLPAATVPGNDTQKATQLPAVVVNLRISDLFPDDVRGKKLLHDAQPYTHKPNNSHAADDASSVSTSISSQTARPMAAAKEPFKLLAALRSYHRLYAFVQHSSDVAGQVASASTSRQTRHLLQSGASTSNSQSTSTGGGNSDQGLSGYLRRNPDSASNLQQLSGTNSPQLGPDTRSATLCEVVSSQCTPGGGRRLQGNSLGFTLAAAVASMLSRPDAASAVARATAALVARQRRLLDSVMPAGLDRWMESADNTDREYAQQLLGTSAPSARASIPEVVADNSDGPQPKRKAARRLLSYDPAPRMTAPGRKLQDPDSSGFSTWFRGASDSDQQYAVQLGLADRTGGKRSDNANIPSVVGGDAGSRRGATALEGGNTNQGSSRASSVSGNGGDTGGGQQSAGGQQQGGRRNHGGLG